MKIKTVQTIFSIKIQRKETQKIASVADNHCGIRYKSINTCETVKMF